MLSLDKGAHDRELFNSLQGYAAFNQCYLEDLGSMKLLTQFALEASEATEQFALEASEATEMSDLAYESVRHARKRQFKNNTGLE